MNSHVNPGERCAVFSVDRERWKEVGRYLRDFDLRDGAERRRICLEKHSLIYVKLGRNFAVGSGIFIR